MPRPTQTSRQSLSRAVCLALLRPGGRGRVATTMRAVPVIVPVSFTMLDEDVVFDAGPGDDVGRAIRNAVVALETDHLRADGLLVWGVHVTGVARPVTNEDGTPGFRLSSEVISGWSVTP